MSEKLIYISSASIPSRNANVVHILKMCDAFAQFTDVQLVCSVFSTNWKFVKEDFRLRNNFSISSLFRNNRRGKFFYYVMYLCKVLLRSSGMVYGRFIFGCLLSVCIGKKTIVELHAPPKTISVFSHLSFYFLSKSKRLCGVVVISDALRNLILLKYPWVADKLHVFHDCSDIKLLEVPRRGSHSRLKVGYVGSLNEGKGWETVVLLSKEFPEIDFYVVGGSDREVKRLTSLYTEFSNLFFLGFLSQNDLFTFYKELDIALLPNKKKVLVGGGTSDKQIDIGEYTSPLKLFEYMSHGLPIISSDLPVLREVLTPDIAMLADPDNLDEWKGCLVFLMREEERFKLGNNAFRLFMQKYTWDYRAKELLTLFH